MRRFRIAPPLAPQGYADASPSGMGGYRQEFDDRDEGCCIAMKLLVYAHRLEVGGTQVNAIEWRPPCATTMVSTWFSSLRTGQCGPW